ncbi:hypothetical protein Lalb_Chr13g0299771 [Lupinus albus]|uniref:Uncharacterized protein n=1 Tax=Lupinus albus TaxID=3870 RepID=A0A6A4PJ90_LUPAL|nr:hypothetical protein Lalb_Chr13g0299771 [Lupinus albus]
MRLPGLIVMLCLLFWVSNTVARKNVFVSNMFDGANEKNTSMVVDSHKCNLESELSCSENNNSTNSDDKRVVPTGPNPLHNR